MLERDGVAVVRNRRALPRAWLVSEVKVVTAKQAMRMIRGEARKFDPARTALLDGENIEPLELGGELVRADAATVLGSLNGHIVVETRSERPAFLVVSESYFPGWVATVDGQPARVYRTNSILLGLAVSAGVHRVELRYTARGAALGGMISIVAGSALIALLLHGKRKRRATGSAR